MTYKQIIIDGVDVSGCKAFYINASHPERKECINPFCKNYCKNNSNCYYKQLKRKEQECEKLKYDLKTEQKDNQFIKKWCIEAGKELAKHSFAWDGKEKNLVVQAMELNERFEAKEKECEELTSKCSQLKQTLAEIKPILEYYANSTIGYKTKDGIYRIELSYKYGYSNSCGEPCYYEYNPKPAKEALRKINEVQGDN